MNTQKYSRLKRLAVLTVAWASVGAIAFGSVDTNAVDEQTSVKRQNAPSYVRVAQSASQSPSSQQTETSPQGQKPAPEAEEKKESGGTQDRPAKDFQPSEKIEAEQAVDFPYDI